MVSELVDAVAALTAVVIVLVKDSTRAVKAAAGTLPHCKLIPSLQAAYRNIRPAVSREA